MADWIDSVDLSAALAIDDSRLRKIARQVHASGKKWHGTPIKVRAVVGQRGGAGGKCWQFHLPSLPEAIRNKLGPQEPRLPLVTDGSMSVARYKLAVLEPILAAEGRKARAEAIKQAVKLHGKSRTTIYKWLDDYHNHGGFPGLALKEGKGRPEVLVSTEWDRATKDCDAEARAKVAADIVAYIKRSIASGTAISTICFDAARFLTEWTETRLGIAGNWKIKEHFVRAQEWGRMRALAASRNNAKHFADVHFPRIQRTIDGLLPMNVVVGDVHHMDFLVNGPDGYQCYPKAVCWYDVATGRIWMDIFLIPTGQAIRTEDVIASFRRMIADPAWGVPRNLMVDNGSEYKWTELLEDMLGFCARFNMTLNTGRHVRKSKPYNAAAKAIEGLFSVLNRTLFLAVAGYIGGDRMNSRVANVGKAPVPFPGVFEDFVTAIFAELHTYHHKPHGDRARLKGMSPWGKFSSFRQWQSTVADPAATAAIWVKRETRKVDQGRIKINNLYYSSDELMKFFGAEVTVLLPKYERDWTRVPVEYEGEIVCYAMPDYSFGHLDGEGAREQSRRAVVQKGALRALSTAYPKLDAIENRQIVNRLADKQLGGPPSATAGARLTASDEQAKFAKAVRISPKDAKRIEREQEEAIRARRRETLQQIEARKAANG
jgi:hypothetical protein